MKGLWIKDWRLFLQQKKFLVVVACILVVFALSTLNLSFALSYGVFMLTYVAVGTISYDDTGKGLSYIFTWPISRRQYVTEKYLFTSAVALGSWLVLVLAGGVIQKIRGITGGQEAWLLPAVMILWILLIFVCVTLPIQFRFGTEQGRLVMFLMLVFLFGAASLAEKLIPQTGMRLFLEKISRIPHGVWGVVAILFLALIYRLSMYCSNRIMQKKEL